MAQQDISASLQIQDTVYRLLQDRPEWRRYLEEMVAVEEKHEGEPNYFGWEWQDVHTSISVINSLITMGIVDLTSKSRAYTHYKLRSRADTQEALAADAVMTQQSDEPIDVHSLFKLVYGHDKAKALLSMAVNATSPVHCLLVGPPGTAKTLLLSDIGRLPGAHFYVGSTTTKAGLVSLLLQVRPRFLVIDEIDKMDDKDMTPLLNLMETGLVTRLVQGSHERMSMDTRVFAGANDTRRISRAILSRFAVREVPAYTPAEFVRVAQSVLVANEGQGPEMAKLIAREVVKVSTDIRDAVRVARMARNHPQRVFEVLGCLWPDRTGGNPVVTLPSAAPSLKRRAHVYQPPKPER